MPYFARTRGVRLVRDRRLLLDARLVSERDLVHGVSAPVRPVLVLARAHRDDDARTVSRPEDRVLRARRTVDEVPLPERTLLTLDDEEGLPGHDEEVLLVGLPVVHGHRLSRIEDLDVDADLREVLVALEVAERAAPLDVVPARSTRVQDVPALTRRHEPVLGRLHARLRDHARELATATL